MALQKVRITNNNQNWNAKRRYKVNDVVNYSGATYQNSTGSNSIPSDLIDWVLQSNENNTSIIIPYSDIILYKSEENIGTVPESGDVCAGGFIEGVYVKLGVYVSGDPKLLASWTILDSIEF